VAYVEPAPRRALPVALVAGGAAFMVVTLGFGPNAIAFGAFAFLLACVLAIRDVSAPVFTWPNALAALIVVIWLIPIKAYALPVELPFNLEPYRLFLVLLVFAWVLQLIVRRGRLEAGGHGNAILLLIAVAVVSTIVNFDELSSAELDSPAKPVSYFVGFLLVFALAASTIDRIGNVDSLLRALVGGAAVVALFALYEARTRYNVFDHLHEYVPALDRQEREVLELRSGRLRVQASAQHPIALGAALAMMLPIAVYLSRRASSAARSYMWIGAALMCATAAVATISRTMVVMLGVMALVALSLRGRAVVRYWPVLLVLPIVIHFVAPGALGGLYKSFVPKEGLIGDVQSRAGEAGSGRFADVVPGLRIWTESPVVGHGLGSQTVFEPEQTRLGPAPPTAVIFDNQYMSTLVQLGLIGLIGAVWLVWGSVVKLVRSARRSTGPPSDLMTACAVSCAGFGAAMLFFDAFAFVQCTLVFVFLAALGLRVRAREQPRRLTLVESRTAPV
jgi:hypothetical protein